MKFTKDNRIEYNSQEQEQRSRYKYTLTYNDLRRFLINDPNEFQLHSDAFPLLDDYIFDDNLTIKVIQNKKVQRVKYGLEMLIKYGLDYDPTLPNHIKCLNAAKDYIKEIHSTPKRVVSFLKNRPFTLILRKSHEKKIEEFYESLGKFFTFNCGVTPTQITISKTDSNVVPVCRINDSWQEFVEENSKNRIYK